MLSPETAATVPVWKAMKDAQWAAIRDAMPGLQLMVSGERGTQYTLVCSPHDESFYEAVIFGQLPQVLLESYGSKHNPRTRDMADEKKPYLYRRIDLGPDHLAQIIACWRDGKSALTLPFVEAVSGADGKFRART